MTILTDVRLGVNIDHVAGRNNVWQSMYPDPIEAAVHNSK